MKRPARTSSERIPSWKYLPHTVCSYCRQFGLPLRNQQNGPRSGYRHTCVCGTVFTACSGGIQTRSRLTCAHAPKNLAIDAKVARSRLGVENVAGRCALADWLTSRCGIGRHRSSWTSATSLAVLGAESSTDAGRTIGRRCTVTA